MYCEFRTAKNRRMFGLCGTLILLFSAGCAPTREDTPGDGGGGGDSLLTALVATEPSSENVYSSAHVYLVDVDYTCDQIRSNYGLGWWDLSSETSWVMTTVYKGQGVDWESSYRSQYSWNLQGEFDYSSADFFFGTFGVGGYGTGDIPPAPGNDPVDEEARDQQGNLGADAAGMDDSLTFSLWSESTVRGSIASEGGDWFFDATNCGELPGGDVGVPYSGGGATTDEP